VAAKQLCDSFCTNVHYARVGGISLRELNTLELEFLFLIDWRLSVGSSELQQYYVNLVRQSGSFNVKIGMVGDNVVLCGLLEDKPYQKEVKTSVPEQKMRRVKEDVSTSGSSSSGQSSGQSSTPSPPNQLIRDTQRMSVQDVQDVYDPPDAQDARDGDVPMV
jgi:hypothetical protein